MIDKIKESSPDVSVEFFELDLASQKSIQKAASQVTSLLDTIDILINNSGVMVPEQKFTEENIELQLGTNHFGHFFLTNLLLDKNKAAAGRSDSVPGSTRIINVTSAGHRLSPIRLHDYNVTGTVEIPPEEQPPGRPAMFGAGSGGYNGWLAYGQSKTANVLFSVYLTRWLKEKGVVPYSVHAGCMSTISRLSSCCFCYF